MKLVALMLVRNEEWILQASLDAALRWCDEVVAMNHASADSTSDILQARKDRVFVYEWPDANRWDEMEQRQRLLDLGRARGGTHFAMIDADEIVTANLIPMMRGWVESLKPREVLELSMIPVWDGLDHYRDDDSVWSRSKLTVAFADAPGMGWAARGDERYQHHNRNPHGNAGTVFPAAAQVVGAGGAMHLQWAAWERVVAKHRRYKLLERLRWPEYNVSDINAKYNQAVCERAVKRSAIPESWWGDLRRDLIRLDAPIWFDEDSKRMLALKPKEYWAGLDLFGGEV